MDNAPAPDLQSTIIRTMPQPSDEQVSSHSPITKPSVWRFVITAAPLLLLIVLLLPVRAWRAAQEESIWVDEVISLMLIQHTPSQIIDERLADRHPSGYFLPLKAWVKLGKLTGLAPSIGWARMLNVAAWLVLTVGCWMTARRMLPDHGAILLTWCVAASASSGQVAKVLRGYGIAYVCVTLCFLLVVTLRRPEPKTLHLWLTFALAGSLALWTHMLSGLVLLLIALLIPLLPVRRSVAPFGHTRRTRRLRAVGSGYRQSLGERRGIVGYAEGVDDASAPQESGRRLSHLVPVRPLRLPPGDPWRSSFGPQAFALSRHLRGGHRRTGAPGSPPSREVAGMGVDAGPSLARLRRGRPVTDLQTGAGPAASPRWLPPFGNRSLPAPPSSPPCSVITRAARISVPSTT